MGCGGMRRSVLVDRGQRVWYRWEGLHCYGVGEEKSMYIFSHQIFLMCNDVEFLS